MTDAVRELFLLRNALRREIGESCGSYDDGISFALDLVEALLNRIAADLLNTKPAQPPAPKRKRVKR